MKGPDQNKQPGKGNGESAAAKPAPDLGIERLTENPVRIDLLRNDISAAAKLFSGPRGSLEEPSLAERMYSTDLGDENARITLLNAAERLLEIGKAIQRNDTAHLPPEMRSWMPQISAAFYIRGATPQNSEVAELQERIVQGLKDLKLIPEDYGKN